MKPIQLIALSALSLNCLVATAFSKQVDRELGIHSGRANAQVGFNRRVTPAHGRTHMGVNRKGSVVPWVNELTAKAQETDRIVAVLFEHPAHPVTVPHTSKLVSADFPGATVSRIRERLGKDVIVRFGQPVIE